jgi:hypothetical protein
MWEDNIRGVSKEMKLRRNEDKLVRSVVFVVVIIIIIIAVVVAW